MTKVIHQERPATLNLHLPSLRVRAMLRQPSTPFMRLYEHKSAKTIAQMDASTTRWAMLTPIVRTILTVLSALFAPLFFVFLCAPLSAGILIQIAGVLPYLFIAGNTLFNAAFTGGVSGGIAHDRRFGMYDLLCTVPMGRAGVHWMHARQWFARNRILYLALIGMGLLSILSAPLSIYTLAFRSAIPSTLEEELIHFLPAAVYRVLFVGITLVQSQALASLIGTTVPLFLQTGTSGDTRLISTVAYLAIEGATIAVMFLLAVSIPGVIAQLILQLILYTAIREWIAFVLVRAAEAELGEFWTL